MNRWLMAAVVGLMAVGCAVGIEDPQPPPGPDPVQKSVSPPAEPFGGELQEITVTQDLHNGYAVPEVPVEVLPMPGR
jgi:hypothetical protein